MNKILLIFLLVPFGVSAQKYDTINIGLTTAVHMVFKSSIVNVDIGLGEFIDEKGEKVKDILHNISQDRTRLSITAGVTNFDMTNLFVETKEGYYNFILRYVKFPKHQLISVEESQALIKKKEGGIDMKLATRDGSNKKDSLAEVCLRILDKGFVDPDVGERKEKMTVYLNGVFVSERLLFFRVTIKNDGNVPFEIGREIFQIMDSQKTGVKDRKVVESPQELMPIYVFNKDMKVGRKEVISKVYVFEKFTVSTKKNFTIDLWEVSPGQRSFQLKVSSSNLLAAEFLN